MTLARCGIRVAPLLAIAALACLVATPALGQPAGFAQWFDLSQIPVEFPQIVEVSEPHYDSNLAEDEGLSFARHIRVDQVLEGERGSFALFLDGDVRIGLSLDWAPPALNDASAMRLLATTTVEVVNLAYRVAPVLEQAGPCKDQGITLMSFGLDAFGLPVKLSLGSRLCGGMSGVNEGAVTGWVRSTCGIAAQDGSVVPVPQAEFVRQFTLSGDARAEGDSSLDLLFLRASAAVERLGAKLLDASVEASCPYIGAQATEGGGGELRVGARARVTVNCSPVLEMLGMEDLERESLYVQRIAF